jgi:hypothetical protein
LAWSFYSLKCVFFVHYMIQFTKFPKFNNLTTLANSPQHWKMILALPNLCKYLRVFGKYWVNSHPLDFVHHYENRISPSGCLWSQFNVNFNLNLHQIKKLRLSLKWLFLISSSLKLLPHQCFWALVKKEI